VDPPIRESRATTMGRRARDLAVLTGAALAALACEASPAPGGQVVERAPRLAPAPTPLPDSVFAALVARISEPGGYFDTDNLISNEPGYLKVLGALDRLGVSGGAYVGVGPDQNYSYIARLRPEIAFITDIRRDNLLHHLLLKALVERADTRLEFLAGLHARPPPPTPEAWEIRSVEELVAYVDGHAPDADVFEALQREVREAVRSWGVPLAPEDLATMRRFHRTFVDAGMGLRFASFGRAPRPYYPTYRQLTLETDLVGRRASYLASPEDYAIVRDLHRANRIIPVVGDLAGSHALREMASVMREMGVRLTAFYASNVEFYLWRNGSFGAWSENLAGLPAEENAQLIRSYFPNTGRLHPTAVPGYYATQIVQPVEILVAGGFTSYWDLVTRGAVELR
jgi:hypothetical protein